MLPVLIQALLLAAGGIFSVGSITIVILLLLSDRGWHSGLAYVTGYVGAYTLIGLGVILLGYNSQSDSATEPGLVTPILITLLGSLLLWLSWRNWRKAPGVNTENPRLFRLIDKITPFKALAFGAAVAVINFKNLAIFLSAVSVILISNLLLPAKIIIVLLVVLVFCSAVIAPVVIYLAFPKQANNRLNRFKQSLENHSRAIGIWVPLVFGLIFLIRGVTGLL